MGERQRIETEVCVIGGGPAGSTIAAKLARMGHAVCLIEQSAFPRPHVGESLPPSILPLLDTLGVRERVEAAPFIRPKGARIRWSNPEQSFAAPSVSGFLVDRGQFDHLLLEAAREAGARVVQPARAAPPLRDRSGGWEISANGATGYDIRARFLVSAAGRAPFAPGRKKRTSIPTLALYGYWLDAECDREQTLVEAGPEEWFWGSPLPGGLFNATVFVAPERCLAARREGIEKLYRTLLASSRLLRGCLRGALAGSVRACSASGYYDESCVDATSIKVGEASFAIDPLSSQGIQAAMRSALQGAVVTHTLLTRPANTRAAVEFYRTRQSEAVEHYADAAAGFYAQQQFFPAHPFWARRSQRQNQASGWRAGQRNIGNVPLDCRVHLCKGARLRETPALDREIVRYVPALIHRSLDRPVAFLGGIEVGTLTPMLDGKLTAAEVAQRWSLHMAPFKCWEVLQWMWSHDLLTASEV